MSFSLPPIVKQAERLLAEIEKAVRSFPRYEKYGCGSDLRAQTRKVCVLTHRAWRQQRARTMLIGRLIDEIDELKILLQLGVRLVDGIPRGSESLEKIKAAIVDGTVLINRKHQEPIKVNAPNFIFCTGDADPLKYLGDRRFFIVLPGGNSSAA